MRFLEFVRGTLSEDGVPSFSRVGSALLVAAYVVIMIRARTIPEHTTEFSLLLLALYGSNQAKAALTAYANAKAPAPADPPAHTP